MLAGFNPYQYLQAIQPQELVKHVRERVFQKGDYVYIPPFKHTEIYEIVKGAVKIGSYAKSGAEICYDVLRPEEFFGNLRYLNGQFFEFAKCLTDVVLREYELNYYKYLIVHDPAVSEWFNVQTVKRWCRAESRLFAVCSAEPEERVNNIRENYGVQIVDANDRRYMLLKLMTMQDIADLTGLTRQTVSRVLKRCEENMVLKA
ncbi:Crp/Fnr family transcriptional regulator [Penaeicola halotolerans]|uniref:Crp/Fnr family transcriptional regulator n=1 Tax=Penaeicola halotolerans TaxID=2793196 RepID=UPI001CF85824|nr:Crp/Fnr family transcriptional regulator [Penaeicola halotolerans]